MAIEIPDIAPRDDRWARYAFANRDAFPAEEWIPTLLAVHTATTVGEQRDALTRAVAFTAGRYYGFDPTNRENRYRPFIPASGIEARIDIVGRTASLASLRVDGVLAGFHTPQYHRHPAYAVIDSHDGGIHDVIHDPTEGLTEAGKTLGISTVRSLAHFLEKQNGRYHLEAELTAEGFPPLTT